MKKYLLLISCLVFLSNAHAAEHIEAWKPLRTTNAVSVKQEWKPTQDGTNITGTQMSIAGQKFVRGLGTHAPGEIVFDLSDKNHKVFRTFVGVDDNGDSTGSVTFTILLDSKPVFESGLMKHGDKAKEVRLNIEGVKELKLVCGDGGNGVQGDWANWAEAVVDDVLSVKPKLIPRYSTAGFHVVPGSPRKVHSFNPGWRFHKGNASGPEKPEFDDSDWEAANLPHGLNLSGSNLSGGRNYQGPAWYRKRFEIPPEMKEKNLVLYFEAVMGKCKIFLDGKQIAEHFGGYLPFAADISGLVEPGQKHSLAVWCDNSDDPNYPPGKPQGNLDFTYLGGIYRDVYLIETSKTHITLPELSPTVAGGGVFVGVRKAQDTEAEIEIRTEVTAKTAYALRTIIENSEGKEIARKEEFNLLNRISVKQNFSLMNVRLWHPDDPYMHWILTEILDENGNVLDSQRIRFGIRLFEMRGYDGFYVNGKPIGKRLSGVNRHQDYAVVGNAIPNSGQWRDALLLREGGSTIIRAAHYPLDPAFMDACDELGLLVTVANPGWQFYNNSNPEFWQRCVADTRTMARRDRNRPAVLLWETALNETSNEPIPMLVEMHKALHEEIPFPGVFSVADSDHARPAGFDVYYYARGDEPISSMSREYGDGGEVENFYSQNAASRVKREWGEQALLNQAMIRYRDLPGIFGAPPKNFAATLWCGIDHQRGYHPDPFWGGLLDEFRIPKYSYYVFKSQYDADFNKHGKIPGIKGGPFVYIANEMTQVSPKNVLIITNCDEVRLTWLGKEVGTKKPDEKYKGLPHPPIVFENVFDFREITRNWRNRLDELELVAEGIIAGEVVCVQRKPYPQRSTRVVLELDDRGVGLVADGSDFVPVRAYITDSQGRIKVLASEYVSFIVDGTGELLGGSIKHVNPMKTEFGIATALVRSTTKPGLIRVRAVSEGLVPSEELIFASAAPNEPLFVDTQYAEKSKRVDNGQQVVLSRVETVKDDTQTLKNELERLKLEMVAKEQEIMELKNRGSSTPNDR